MKKWMILTVLALGCAESGWGQMVDSLLAVKQVDSLLTTATKLWRAQKNEEALPLAQLAADISKQKWGEYNASYAASLHRLASIYNGLGQYPKAEEMYLKTIDLRGKVLGKEHPDYAGSLNNLTILYRNTGDSAKEEPLLLELKEIWAKTLGKEHLKYASCLNNLGSLYYKKGDYTNAEPLYLEAKAIYAKVGHVDYVAPLKNLCLLYRDKGEYAKEELFLLELKEILINEPGKEHQEYAECLYNLAMLFLDKSDYDKAEPLYLEAIDIFEKTLGREHPDYAGAINGLANLYRRKGDYAKAKHLYLEAIAITAKTSGRESKDYAGYLHNLAILYMNEGDYAKAELLFLEVVEVFAKAVGKEHSDYANALTNLANLYHYESDYVKAEPLYLEAKEILIKVFGKERPEYALLLSNLANLYTDKSDYATAEPMYLDAKEILTKTFGREHPYYARILEHLADYYQKTNRVRESAALFLEANELNRYLIEKSAAYSSENQMLAYLYTFDESLARFQSFAQAYSNPELNRASFDNALFYNGLLLENARHLGSSIARADSLTRDVFERWQGCRRRLAKEYSKPIAERRFVDEVEAEAESYEKMLIRNLPRFSETRRRLHWQDVRDRMRPDEAAVEFIQYQYYTPAPTDTTVYAALLLRPGWPQPRFVPLFEEEQLTEKISCKGLDGDVAGCANQRYAPAKSSAILRLLWQPLDSLLEGSKTVYYSPSGQLHWLDFGALSIGGGQRLSDKYRLVRLGSSRQLVVRDTAFLKKSGSNALLFGGVRYEADSAAIAKANEGLNPNHYRGQEFSPALGDSTLRAGEWRYLPESATEIENISRLFDHQKIPFHVFGGFAATEETFKRIGQDAPPPRVLHLATHGFFIPAPKEPRTPAGVEPVFRIPDHPMIRSGLVLAGANHARKTGKPYREGADDGILTAYEISQINLQGTELVVLSACQTGLGDLSANEGVYGLQRAFKIAGARYLVMSLQPVPDRPTQEFMTQLYQNWLVQDLPLPDAFREAQTAMRTKYPDQPVNWAGWILME